jgi:Fe-S cluster assembly protein SufD
MADRTLAPADSYVALFDAALESLPGARQPGVRQWREASFERFRAQGFPGPKSESWKYTSLAPIAHRAFALPGARAAVRREVVAPLRVDGACNLVFVNGRFMADLSDDPADLDGIRISTLGAALERGGAEVVELAGTEAPERSFSALNAAFASDGTLVQAPAGASPGRPLHLLFLATPDDQQLLISPRNLILLGDGARLELIETHATAGQEAEHLTNLESLFVLGRGGELRHDRLQIGATAGDLIGRNVYRISADARLTQTVATVGGNLVRNETGCVIAGRGADVHLNGLYLARGRQHVDTQIEVDHAEPGSESNQHYKGVLDERARAVFAGRIMVRRDAQKTNAYQSNNNLLLSPEAEIDTKPELEIYADDVKCSHGATAGELDERELFYLRSRGLDPELARSLLTYAFTGAVLERFANEEVARRARAEVLRWLPGGAALEELA